MPRLIASHPSHGDRPRLLTAGTELRIRLDGPRRCTGLWQAQADRRRHCDTAISPQGAVTQCPACAADDRGRALARDRHLDDREYVLYLAWFGPGLLKVGLTAAEHGQRRLLEQGALAHTVIARGPLASIRRAEKALTRHGVAAERIPASRKLHAWWTLPEPHALRAELAEAPQAALATGLLDTLTSVSDTLHDHTARYGLHRGVPDTYRTLTRAADPAHVAVRIRAVSGRHILAHDLNDDTVLLVDTRLLAGRTMTPGNRPTSGLHTTPTARPETPHAQPRLF